MGHWTGHPSRLNPATLVKGIEEGFASPHNAHQELWAEISSMMTGDRLRLGHDPSRHAAYVESWLEAQRDDPREIHRAAQDAQVMSDYVLDRAREKAPDRAAKSATRRERPAPEPVRPAPEQPQFRGHFQREAGGPSRQRTGHRQPPAPNAARPAAIRTRGLAHSAFADRLRGMAFVIDRVDSLGYVASGACMREEATGTLSVPLGSAAAFYLRETVPGGRREPLALALWESGHDLVIKDGAHLLPHLAAGAQIYATGRLHRRILEIEDETRCRNEVVCVADDVLVLRRSDGGRLRGSPAG